MRGPWFLGVLWAACVASLSIADDAPTYERDVRPLLRTHCTICHNARKVDAIETSGGLALDSFDAIQRGLKERRVVQSGHAEESSLYRRLVEDDEEKRMPKDAEPLEDAQRLIIQRWIDAGLPRGEATKSEADAPARPRRVVRTLDVTVPLEIKVENKAVQAVLKVGPLPAVTALAFRPQARWLAVGTVGQVVVWDLEKGAPELVVSDLPGAVHALAFRPDGQALALGGGLAARSGLARVYDLDGNVLAEMTGHDDVVSGFAFSADGRKLASASLDGTVRVWDAATGEELAMSKGHSDFVNDVAFAPDGQSVLSASKDRSIKRFDAGTGKGLRTYSDHNDDVLALAIKPDGSEFVSAGNEPQLRWWKVDGDKPARRQGGHGGPVHQLVFSADGNRLLSASGDGTARVWDGKSGAAVKTLAGAADWQYAAALSADGKAAAAAGWDGQVRVWDVESGKLRVVLVQPTPLEWSRPAWLAIAPAGAAAVSESLQDLLRWKTDDGEKDASFLIDTGRLQKALRGEPLEAK